MMRAAGRTAFRVALVLLGGLGAWRTAPDVEGVLFPALTDVYPVPYDPAHPHQMVSQQLDRVCIRTHVHKQRDAETYRWLVTITGPDGARHFSEPIDARTGESYSSRNSRASGFDGTPAYCAILPDNFDATLGYTVESYVQYLPRHHLWTIEQVVADVTVPPIGSGS